MAVARNNGFRLARGLYISFADQGGKVSSDLYSALISNIIKYCCDIALANVNYMTNEICQPKATIHSSKVVYGGSTLLKCLSLESTTLYYAQ